MESLHDLKIAHWCHELPRKCSAGVLACEFTRRLAGCSCWRRDAAATRSRDGCATRLMESQNGKASSCLWQQYPDAPVRLRSEAGPVEAVGRTGRHRINKRHRVIGG